MLDALLAEARLRWGLDPAGGFAVVPAERLVGVPLEPSRPALIVPLVVLHTTAPPDPPTPLPGRHGPRGRDALAVLQRLYPADHPVGRFGVAEGTTVGALEDADLATPLYLGPVAPELAAASPWGMPWISSRLREPDGCPWDREQTHESLRNHLLEEAYEVYDALADGATPELAAELGDLWLQVVLHAQLAAEAGVFDLADVQAAIASKIVRRHPHVFGDAEVRTADRREPPVGAHQAGRAGRGGGRVGRGRPTATRRPRRRAPSTGSAAPCRPWRRARRCRSGPPTSATTGRSIDGILAKVTEEMAELAAADDATTRAEELGDLLMVVVNLARHHGVDAEAALRSGNDKFRRRFGDRGAPGGRARRGPARPLVRGARRAVGRGEGGAGSAPAELAAKGPGGQNGPRRCADDDREPRPGPASVGAAAGRAAAGDDDARRPEVGRGLLPDPRRRHGGAVRGHDRGPRPAPPARQGERLGHRRVLHAAALHRRADDARGDRRQGRRPDARDPAPHRPLAAGRRGPGAPRRADGHGRLRRPPGRRRARGPPASRAATWRSAAALITYGMERLLVGKVAAVSVGILDGVPVLDLDYAED